VARSFQLGLRFGNGPARSALPRFTDGVAGVGQHAMVDVVSIPGGFSGGVGNQWKRDGLVGRSNGGSW
jgi:hypothetical protein